MASMLPARFAGRPQPSNTTKSSHQCQDRLNSVGRPYQKISTMIKRVHGRSRRQKNITGTKRTPVLNFILCASTDASFTQYAKTTGFFQQGLATQHQRKYGPIQCISSPAASPIVWLFSFVPPITSCRSFEVVWCTQAAYQRSHHEIRSFVPPLAPRIQGSTAGDLRIVRHLTPLRFRQHQNEDLQLCPAGLRPCCGARLCRGSTETPSRSSKLTW